MLSKTFPKMRFHILVTGITMAGIALAFGWGMLFGKAIPGWERHALAAPTPAELHVCASGCDYSTLQSAVNAAQPGDTIKVAGGNYTGLFTYNDMKQMVYITEPLNILGGYSPDNWAVANPAANPTVLDAQGGGRVMVIWGNISVHVEGLRMTNGNANELGGCFFGLEGPAGGAVYIRDATVTISNTLIDNSVAAVSKNRTGCGGGLYAQSAALTLLGSTIQNNKASTGQAGYSKGGGLVVIFGSAYLENNQVLNNTAGYRGGYCGDYGGIWMTSVSQATLVHNLVSGNTTWNGDAQGMYLMGTTITLAYNQITNNSLLSGLGSGGGVWCKGACTLVGNLIAGNQAYTGGGAFLEGNPIVLDNNVIVDNQIFDGVRPGSGLYFQNSTVILRHNTVARNLGGQAIYLANSPTTSVNLLIADSSIGVEKSDGQYTVSLDHTLYSNIITQTVNAGRGTLDNLNPLTGPSGFDTDGYHLTQYSAALNQGLVTTLLTDIDGEARPMPAGTLPDIGADELNYGPGTEFTAEKAAFAPLWVADADHPAGRLVQRYLLRYFYGSPDANPPDLLVAITDTLPAELSYLSDTRNPTMTFQQNGQTLTWQTAEPVAYHQTGEVQLVTIYDQPEPARIYTNTAELRAGAYHFNLEAVSQALVVAPLISRPGSGELCTGTVSIEGQAQPGVSVTLYANNAPLTTVSTGSDGRFSASYDYQGGQVTLKARACAPNGKCSIDSRIIEIEPNHSFWCPQRSIWQHNRGVSYFRNANGKFSTINWVIPGYYGFSNTHLILYACNCPSTGKPPIDIWAVADGKTYFAFREGNWYHFFIGKSHTVQFRAQCGPGAGGIEEGEPGAVLIDPDGFIFDINQGFDPLSPTLHALPGITVTAYVSMPEWGGWVPWPAHLYEAQINPQVTGPDGYFAFFTPPGFYYLQVQGKPGYQSWRSPVIQVINEIVHVNVPLTPREAPASQTVLLSPEGPEPTVLTITAGSSVAWLSIAPAEADIADVIRWTDTPILRALSDLDPLANPLGFDSGMLAPGRKYERAFLTPGTYTYTDGAGNSGRVVVQAPAGLHQVYLPLVRR